MLICRSRVETGSFPILIFLPFQSPHSRQSPDYFPKIFLVSSFSSPPCVSHTDMALLFHCCLWREEKWRDWASERCKLSIVWKKILFVAKKNKLTPAWRFSSNPPSNILHCERDNGEDGFLIRVIWNIYISSAPCAKKIVISRNVRWSQGWISFCAKTGKASKQEHVCPLAHIGFTVGIGLDYRPCSTNGTAGMCPSFTSFNSSAMF